MIKFHTIVLSAKITEFVKDLQLIFSGVGRGKGEAPKSNLRAVYFWETEEQKSKKTMRNQENG